jgi:hypothetical protein
MHAMTYDSFRRKIILVGGSNDGTSGMSDTWEWDGQTWDERAPATSPPARDYHAMAYDSVRGESCSWG